jgi:organic hydroperoxide reductase OsmC/OhrA
LKIKSSKSNQHEIEQRTSNQNIMKSHSYSVNIRWTGNTGTGTSSYTAYSRDHVISIKDKADIEGSSDPAFQGDPSKHNPEDMLVSALSTCHMLWYLHLCADNDIIVTEYTDKAYGVMEETNHGGRFTEVTLHPRVTITDPARIPFAQSLHEVAHEKCFIANSCNFPVRHKPECFAKIPASSLQ